MTNLLLPPKDLWSPAFYTKPLTNTTRGEDVIEFAELLLKAERGFRAGESLQFTQWQQWLLNSLYETDENGLLRYRRAVVGLPRKNGKSLLGSSLALEALAFGEPGGQIFSAAGDREQASIVFNTTKKMVEDSEYLSRIIKVYRNSLVNPATGSTYRVLSSDGKRAHGYAPSLTIADEIHAWASNPNNRRGDELWEALESGSSDRPESLLVAITTAGDSEDSLLGKLYEHGKKVSGGEIEDPYFGFFWWEAGQDSNPLDREVWNKANPNIAEGLLSVESLEADINQASSTSFSSFQRFHLNQWVRTAGESFISDHYIHASKRDKKVPLGSRIVAGFDGSISGDATALVGLEVSTGTIFVVRVWEPDFNDPEWTVDREEINASVNKMFSDYDVVMLWCDPSFYQSDVEDWAKRHRGKVQSIPPTGTRMAPMAQEFLKLIVDNELGHDGNVTLMRHWANAVATDSGSFRKEKKNSPRKVDLLASSILASGAYASIKNKNTNTWKARVL
jgi:phage terminase large subunit-like protein